MQIKKTTATLFAVFLIATGTGIGYLLGGSRESKTQLSPTSYNEQFEKLDADSLLVVRETVDDVLEKKASSSIDTLMQLGRVKDSLLVVVGNIKTNLRIVKDSRIRLQLDSTLTTVKDLVSETEKIIMDSAIELLRPTNAALRTLIKDMKERTEKLENLAKTIATVSDVISTLTNILSSPVFSSISTAPTT